MVVTRSQSGEERGCVFDDPPRSPSEPSAVTGRGIPTTTVAAAGTVAAGPAAAAAGTAAAGTAAGTAAAAQRYTGGLAAMEAWSAPLAPLAGAAPSVYAATETTAVHSSVPRSAAVYSTLPSPAPRPTTAIYTGAVPRTPRSPNRSVRSHRSSTSAAVRIKQAEIAAMEKLADIRRRELQMEAEIVQKKLAFEIASIRDDESEASRENIDRVHQWLCQQEQPSSVQLTSVTVQPTTVTATPAVDPAAVEQHEERIIRRVNTEVNTAAVQQPATPRVEHTHATRGERPDWHTPRQPSYERQRSPTPQRSKSTGRGIEQLAEAISKMARTRAPPKQVIELPTFTGAPGEWLPFKAAMRDSAAIYNFSNVENMARLRNSLKGEAREAVRALLHTAKDPEVIMRTLEQCFGRPEIIVDQSLEELKKLPRPGSSASELNNLAIKLQNIVQVLSSLDQRGYLYNPMLSREVIDKLSPHLRSKWCDYAEEQCNHQEPQIETLSRFLMKEADRALKHAYSSSAAAPKLTKTSYVSSSKPIARTKAVTYTTTADPVEEERCLYCGAAHKTSQCDKFKTLSTDDRWKWVREKRVCFKCINRRHRRFNCKAKKCGVDGCERPHHALLHSVRTATPPPSEAAPTNDGTVLTFKASTIQHSAVLLKICPVTITGPGGEEDTYALLDEGSTTTLIDADLARKIDARGSASPLHIHGVNSTRLEKDSHRVKIKIKTEEQDWDIVARTVEGLTLTKQSIPARLLRCSHLEDLPIEKLSYDSATPRLLIGADNWDLIVTRELKAGKKNEPAASRTCLGWVVHGVAPRNQHINEASILHLYTKSEEDKKLQEQIEAHFRIDALGITPTIKVSASNKRATEIFNNTIASKNGHYEVGLTWKEDDPKMPPSYEQAFRRLKTIEKKMDRDSDFAKQYNAQVDNLIAKGYAEECDESDKKRPYSWFLPHFAVTNPNKPGKIRLVFDAAAVANGTSLNDMLLEGPDLLRSLLGILFKFREYSVAITADIEEMFLRIKIRREDQAAQMFLWRGSERKKPPKEMKMKSMIFGASCSPFLAHSVRNHNAHVHASSHPKALEALTEHHYMDDYVVSYKSIEETVQTIKEVIAVNSKAGFKLRSWNSNKKEAIQDVPKELHATTNTQLGHSNKTLGLIWNPQEDTLGFNTSMPRVPEEVRSGQRTPTKRESLSAVMSVYDPLGLLSCFTISAKIFLQNLWRLNIDWDEPLQGDYADGLTTWLEQLQQIATLKLPRCYSLDNNIKRKQLHVFCDASQDAYAAAAYWRMEKEDGSIDVVLSAAKSKVAPIKAQSIPRLELQAALIGARLADTIQQEHRWTADDVIFWTDSSTVLHWIRKDAKKYTPFVAHRLGEIAERTHASQWRWTPTHHNVADAATRSSYVPNSASDWWFTGPTFLRESEDKWPKETTTEEDEDVEVVHHISSNEDKKKMCLPEVDRFSSYLRLLRATATMLLFLDKCRRRGDAMTTAHLHRAEKLLIKKAQEDSFPEELASLRSGKPIAKSSRLKKLDPELDDDGLLRLRGRINAAKSPTQMKKPLILDGRHNLTRLIVMQEHENAGHAGRERVVNELRQKFWILRLRPTVRTVARDCLTCRVRKAKPCVPICGDLPAARVDPYHRPFTNCGVDYFGPLLVTIGRRREKRWGALFTCLTTRAIHLELVGSLTTDSAIMALRRMAARRGWPSVMYSDNATNFRGADVELRAAYAEWTTALQDYGLKYNMEWKFIPPGAPNQGGAWERLVRSVKVALKAVLHEKTPKEEVLQTVLAEAEHSINARPLTHVSVEPEDPEALTPNHFLLGSSSGLPQTGPCDLADRRTWRASQALADEFWRRWVKEYMPMLVARGESRDNSQRQLQPGDLVIVVDPTLPRNTWPRGIVEKVYPGQDGGIRSAEVRTRGGVFKRPTSKLAVLAVTDGGCVKTSPGGECCGQQDIDV